MINNRIVIDTNVFIGSLISPHGSNREMIRRCLRREYQPLIGNTLSSEYESVMERREIIDRCRLNRHEIDRLLNAFLSVSGLKFTALGDLI